MNTVETETCKCTSKQNINCTYFTSKNTVCIIPRTFSSKTFKKDSPDTNLTHGREKVTYAWRSSTQHRDGCFLDDHPDACKNHVEILYKSFLFSFRISSTTSQAIPCMIHLNKMMMTLMMGSLLRNAIMDSNLLTEKTLQCRMTLMLW